MKRVYSENGAYIFIATRVYPKFVFYSCPETVITKQYLECTVEFYFIKFMRTINAPKEYTIIMKLNLRSKNVHSRRSIIGTFLIGAARKLNQKFVCQFC